MNDTKNILLAWISSLSSVFAAIEARTWITIISAIVLPVVFEMMSLLGRTPIGKTVDVVLQIHFRRGEKGSQSQVCGADEITLTTGEAKAKPVEKMPKNDERV